MTTATSRKIAVQQEVQSAATVSVETFARDLWEALRGDLRDQLGTFSDFDSLVPNWENLTPQARLDKVQSVRADLLKPITRAGYEIRRKV